MVQSAKEIISVNIEDEIKQSYLDYAMSVIVGRALPDARDGLKPVHRRALFAMYNLGNDWNKPYKKSARIVGDVIGKYHPHGDTAVYESIVRMAQSFSMRYLLVDGQGNFGSVDGDAPAAMRYTEVRMTKAAHALLADLDKETVDFSPNYDETELVPDVLPTRLPNLLVNGSAGIAVGMATNIPPHNLSEVIDACVALIGNPSLSVDHLMKYVPGPDFPTGAIINGRSGILQAYRTGRGRVYVRAKAGIETLSSGKEAIVITELPYQVNKARLLEKIGALVKDKKIEGISTMRDESDKRGMRVVIEIRKSDNAEVILNNLYSQTQMQIVFGINMVALDEGQPKTLNLKQCLEIFLRHRRNVVTRRSEFELRKAQERAHILEGLGIALVNIDEVITLIKKAKTPIDAKEQLIMKTWAIDSMEKILKQSVGDHHFRLEGISEGYGLTEQGYRLTPDQAQAILDLRLHRLTGLEQDKIIQEYQDILKKIKGLLDILHHETRLLKVIHDELLEVKETFGDKRLTEISDLRTNLHAEDLIAEENVVVTISHLGYAKIQNIDTYQAQRRGGRGKIATTVKNEDFIEYLLIANTHDTVLCFSNKGKVYWLKVYQIPQGSRTSRGRPMVNILPLQPTERIEAIVPVKEYSKNQYVFMATAKGIVKKVSLERFSRPRPSGLIALELLEGDRLIGVEVTDGKQDIMLFSNVGKVLRFNESDVRPMGRTARGVRGIKLKTSQHVIAVIVTRPEGSILTATENGYGKRTRMKEYRTTGRGGQGMISIIVNQRNGNVIGACQVNEGDDVMLITDHGVLVRTHVKEISQVGRNTQGVRLINLAMAEKLASIQRVVD